MAGAGIILRLPHSHLVPGLGRRAQAGTAGPSDLCVASHVASPAWQNILARLPTLWLRVPTCMSQKSMGWCVGSVYMSFYGLAWESPKHLFCCILFLRSKSLRLCPCEGRALRLHLLMGGTLKYLQHLLGYHRELVTAQALIGGRV